MQTVTVGAFQHQDVGTLGRHYAAQQWIARGTQITGEDDPRVATGSGILDLALDIGRSQQMTGTL
ncbi:hypothetical protein D3C79_855690 [compost metagenome]